MFTSIIESYARHLLFDVCFIDGGSFVRWFPLSLVVGTAVLGRVADAAGVTVGSGASLGGLALVLRLLAIARNCRWRNTGAITW